MILGIIASCFHSPQKGLNQKRVEMWKYFSMDFEFYPDTVTIGHDALITVIWKNVSDSSFYLYPKSVMALLPFGNYLDSLGSISFWEGHPDFIGHIFSEKIDFDNKILLQPNEEYNAIFVLDAEVLKDKRQFTRGTGYYSLTHHNPIDSIRYGFNFSHRHPLTIIETGDSSKTQNP